MRSLHWRFAVQADGRVDASVVEGDAVGTCFAQAAQDGTVHERPSSGTGFDGGAEEWRVKVAVGRLLGQTIIVR